MRRSGFHCSGRPPRRQDVLVRDRRRFVGRLGAARHRAWMDDVALVYGPRRVPGSAVIVAVCPGLWRVFRFDRRGGEGLGGGLTPAAARGTAFGIYNAALGSGHAPPRALRRHRLGSRRRPRSTPGPRCAAATGLLFLLFATNRWPRVSRHGESLPGGNRPAKLTVSPPVSAPDDICASWSPTMRRRSDAFTARPCAPRLGRSSSSAACRSERHRHA